MSWSPEIFIEIILLGITTPVAVRTAMRASKTNHDGLSRALMGMAVAGFIQLLITAVGINDRARLELFRLPVLLLWFTLPVFAARRRVREDEGLARTLDQREPLEHVTGEIQVIRVDLDHKP